MKLNYKALKSIEYLTQGMQLAEANKDYRTFYLFWGMLKAEILKLNSRKEK